MDTKADVLLQPRKPGMLTQAGDCCRHMTDVRIWTYSCERLTPRWGTPYLFQTVTHTPIDLWGCNSVSLVLHLAGLTRHSQSHDEVKLGREYRTSIAPVQAEQEKYV